MSYHAEDTLDWNIIATIRERQTRVALANLRRLGEFRTSRYPRVVVGRVSPDADVLAELGAMEAAGEEHGVSRLRPVLRSVPFERDDVAETACVEVDSWGDRIAGKRFYVRASLRGMKGRLEHPAVERAIGDFLFERAMTVGDAPVIDFKNPDVVVTVEVVGARLGCGLYAPAEREHALVRLR